MQFRTKARAVDLLGKGQIADLPTAITELWKNGYDAYADLLSAEIYQEGYKELDRSYFVISDDGKGMSKQDILEKWLVLGTDSKSRATLELEATEDTLWKKPRIKAGEKGIGRLSVAYLGNPMLMLTKKRGYPLQAMFFDWRLLENYNLFLDDITIPVEDVYNTSDFIQVFEDLKEQFLANFNIQQNTDGQDIWESKQLPLQRDILTSVQNSQLVDFLQRDLLEDMTELLTDNGTKFFIFEPIPQILQMGTRDPDDLDDKKFLISSLSGFTNPFKNRNNDTFDVRTIFPIHSQSGDSFDLLTSQGKFFTEDDFSLADVFISGEFNGDGGFDGTIRIYDEVVSYQYNNPRRKDRRSSYGKIPIRLGYSQGEEKSSTLDEFAFKRLRDKVSEYGGLYVFRDDFRVLPYGREFADFLNFEGRRSKRAGTYYFSYRRMYGYIGITRDGNPDLKDKSSREGFINNAAYRAFVSDASNFFIELAADYFSTEAKKSLFLDKKKLLNDQQESLVADRLRERQAKIAFTKSLNEYPDRLKRYKEEYQWLLDQLEEKVSKLNLSYGEVESILDRIHQMDAEYGQLLPKVPKKFKPTETQMDRLEKYGDQLENFKERVLDSKAQLFKKAEEKLEIRDLKLDFNKKFGRYNAELERTISDNRDVFKTKADDLLKDYNQRAKRFLEEFNKDREMLLDGIDQKSKVSHAVALIDSRFHQLLDEINKTLLPLVEHIKNLNFDFDEELIQGAYKAEYEAMRYQWEQTRETAQLGIAVEIIDHEFNQLYAKINHSLELVNAIGIIYDNPAIVTLTKSFKQLEDKYSLLSPLYRISGAMEKEITGEDIYKYLLDFFENTISENNIDIKASPAFLGKVLIIKEPVIHTVYINVINNAIYWMRNASERKIILDYLLDTDEIIIANSGTKIEEYRIDKIFQLFYSNRPNGRGIGLYLTKQSLNEAGLDIYATNEKTYNTLKGACFIIKPI
ncbi:MAG: hypothetical protein EOO20_02215 [Chryseobacterium sp.]|nr:MAG: hypothetical protein EOO20_02215 [Chryseobacterium sp.]